jgi:hypothetical protein
LAFTWIRSITLRNMAHSSGSSLTGVRCSTLMIRRAATGRMRSELAWQAQLPKGGIGRC